MDPVVEDLKQYESMYILIYLYIISDIWVGGQNYAGFRVELILLVCYVK